MNPTQPCTCRAPNAECQRAGLPMVGRWWELCSGKCPPERPCTNADSNFFRQQWDDKAKGIEPPAYQACTVVPAKPSLLRRAVNFAGAMVDHAAHGWKKLSLEQTQARLAICHDCENYVAAGDSCRLCGCNLSVKASWAEQTCPADKWSKVA